jgi:hypothetical protein
MMLNGKIVSAENCSELEIVSSVPEDEAEEEVVLIAEKRFKPVDLVEAILWASFDPSIGTSVLSTIFFHSDLRPLVRLNVQGISTRRQPLHDPLPAMHYDR